MMLKASIFWWTEKQKIKDDFISIANAKNLLFILSGPCFQRW